MRSLNIDTLLRLWIIAVILAVVVAYLATTTGRMRIVDAQAFTWVETGVTPVSCANLTINGVPQVNGTMIYCSDCKNVVDDSAVAGAACTGSGSGAVARFEHGSWRCN